MSVNPNPDPEPAPLPPEPALPPEEQLDPEPAQDYGALIPPRATTETDPLRRVMGKVHDVKRALEQQERSAPVRNSSITGGEGQKLLAEDGETVRVWLRPDGTVVAYDETGQPKVRMGAMVETGDSPGADAYGIEVEVAGTWIQLGTQVVSWENVGGKPDTYPSSPHKHPGEDVTSKVASAGTADSATTASQADGVTPAAFAREVGGLAGSTYAMWMHSTGVMGRNTSSRKYKRNIRPARLDPAAVLQLEPVVYDRKPSQGDENTPAVSVDELGLIAEDVEAILPHLAVWYEGEIDSVRYDLVAVALLSVVKADHALLERLESKVRQQAELLDKMTAALETLGVKL